MPISRCVTPNGTRLAELDELRGCAGLPVEDEYLRACASSLRLLDGREHRAALGRDTEATFAPIALIAFVGAPGQSGGAFTPSSNGTVGAGGSGVGTTSARRSRPAGPSPSRRRARAARG